VPRRRIPLTAQQLTAQQLSTHQHSSAHERQQSREEGSLFCAQLGGDGSIALAFSCHGIRSTRRSPGHIASTPNCSPRITPAHRAHAKPQSTQKHGHRPVWHCVGACKLAISVQPPTTHHPPPTTHPPGRSLPSTKATRWRARPPTAGWPTLRETWSEKRDRAAGVQLRPPATRRSRG
jgi:hypothetical protein